MRTISAERFKEYCEANPLWALTVKTPTVIRGYCDMKYSNVGALSPLLTFAGDPDKSNQVASFKGCTLTIVAGTFLGHVDFSQCKIGTVEPSTVIELHPNKNFSKKEREDAGAASFRSAYIRSLAGTFHGKISAEHALIQEIVPGKLHITGKDIRGMAADFSNCNTPTARGRFAGFVDFSESEIEEIDPDQETGLIITETDDELSIAADFSNCSRLKTATGTYPGEVDFFCSGIEEAKNLHVTGVGKSEKSACMGNCENLSCVEGTFEGFVDFGVSAIEKINREKFVVRNPLRKTGCFCNLENTPFAKRDPIAAASITLGTTSLKEMLAILETRSTEPRQLPRKPFGLKLLIQKAITARELLKKTDAPLEI